MTRNSIRSIKFDTKGTGINSKQKIRIPDELESRYRNHEHELDQHRRRQNQIMNNKQIELNNLQNEHSDTALLQLEINKSILQQ